MRAVIVFYHGAELTPYIEEQMISFLNQSGLCSVGTCELIQFNTEDIVKAIANDVKPANTVNVTELAEAKKNAIIYLSTKYVLRDTSNLQLTGFACELTRDAQNDENLMAAMQIITTNPFEIPESWRHRYNFSKPLEEVIKSAYDVLRP